MEYRLIAQTRDIPDGAKKKVMLDQKALLLTNIHGTFYAIDDRCPHMGGSLSAGKLEGDRVICPKHGTMFDVKTGKVTQNGKIAFIKLNVSDVRTYPVKVEGENILIGIE